MIITQKSMFDLPKFVFKKLYLQSIFNIVLISNVYNMFYIVNKPIDFFQQI